MDNNLNIVYYHLLYRLLHSLLSNQQRLFYNLPSNKVKRQISHTTYTKNTIDNLNNSYIRNLYANQFNLSVTQISPEMIAAKRAVILLKRTIKEIQNEKI